MRTFLSHLVFLFFFNVGAGSLLAQGNLPEHSSIPYVPLYVVPIGVEVPVPPIPFKAHGRWNLAYELRIASFADKGDVEITGIEVLGTGHKVLVNVSGEALKACIEPEAAVGTTLKPRTYTTIFLWISAGSLDEIPARLGHRITLKDLDRSEDMVTEVPEVPVDRQPLLTIDAPLRGNGWVAANGPSNSSIHRRAVLPTNGTTFVAQKYAIDWAQAYDDGKWSRGDDKVNRNYRGYGQPVYAVADGNITETNDAIPENVPGDSRAVEITMKTAFGDHVIEKIGARAYATYAHLQPGSLRAKAGDHVRRGQLLGLLGNSGNANAPHLHFQVCDGNSLLLCNGVPYAISSFEIQPEDKAGGPQKRVNEIPIEGDVVDFPAAR